jgi:hypothetical protein
MIQQLQVLGPGSGSPSRAAAVPGRPRSSACGVALGHLLGPRRVKSALDRSGLTRTAAFSLSRLCRLSGCSQAVNQFASFFELRYVWGAKPYGTTTIRPGQRQIGVEARTLSGVGSRYGKARGSERQLRSGPLTVRGSAPGWLDLSRGTDSCSPWAPRGRWSPDCSRRRW